MFTRGSDAPVDPLATHRVHPMKEEQDASTLAERIRGLLPGGHASEKRMFGGVTFLVKGNMLCCAFKHGLMLRVGTDAEAAALSKPFVRRLSETRKMPGFVFIEPTGIAEKASLSHWIGTARAFVVRLPPKAAKKTLKSAAKSTPKKTAKKAVKKTAKKTAKSKR
jgi:hypothetical protein